MKITFLFSVLLIGQLSYANLCNTYLDKSKSLKEIKSILKTSSYELNAYDFDKLTLDDIKKYFMSEYIKADDILNKIVSNKAKPTFRNTIVALEEVFLEVDKTYLLVSHLKMTKSSPDVLKLFDLIEPLRLDLVNKKKFSTELFERVESVWKNDQIMRKLNKEQTRITKKYLDDYLQDGINLPKESQKRLAELSLELKNLEKKFQQNIDDNNKEVSIILEESEVAGIPKNILEATQELANEIGQPGKYVFSPEYGTEYFLLTHAESEVTRKKAYDIINDIAQSGQFDNGPVIFDIVKLRKEQANLLGKPTFAEAVASKQMSKSEKNVLDFLNKLKETVRPFAEKEKEALMQFVHQSRGEVRPLEPWNRAYYGRLYNESLNKFQGELVRPYFELDHVLATVFDLIKKLYAVEYRPINVPLYDKNVRAFLVHDIIAKKDLGLFYFDGNSRPGKQSSSCWMENLRPQHCLRGKAQLPLVVNVLNIPQTAEGKPVLLKLGEVETILHEVGHANHSLLSTVKFPSIAGTNVPVDFVEIPSTFMENFLFDKSFLKQLGKHYQTKEPLSDELIEKIIKSRNTMAATNILRQVELSLLDMYWHGTEGVNVTDIKALEDSIFTRSEYEKMMTKGTISKEFSHAFDIGYAANYYSYKWSDAIQANLIRKSYEVGLYNQENAARLREYLWSVGNSTDLLSQLEAYLGGDLDPDALLKLYGLK